jgi:acetyl esterase/lipase
MNASEGIPACERLAKAGILAFLLDYRVPNEQRMVDKEIVPLTDAQRAIQYARENAGEWGISPDRIGIMGFSAGGHLASTVGTKFNETSLDNRKQINLRPDFMVLIYPVISFADSLTHEESRNNLVGPSFDSTQIRVYSSELQVTEETPPTFISTALNDGMVKAQNSLYFIAALQQKHVPVESFIYLKGDHGYGVYNRTAAVQWIDACISWVLKDKWKRL